MFNNKELKEIQENLWLIYFQELWVKRIRGKPMAAQKSKK
jgi:hypothetical protein